MAKEKRKAATTLKKARSRDAVLTDFQKIAGPLRGRNRDQKPKA